MESLFKALMVLVVIGLCTGLCAGESVSVYFDASGVILNHNFTKEFYMEDAKDCESCQALASTVTRGFWKMLDFFVRVNLFQDSSLINKTSEGVFFRPPSVGGPEINATKEREISPDEQKEERGVFFIMVMRLDLNVTDSARNLHELKALIQASCWLYLRTVVHFQLHQQLRLNSTAFRFQEIPKSQVVGYLKLLRLNPQATSNNNNDCNNQRVSAATSYGGFYLIGVGLILTKFIRF